MLMWAASLFILLPTYSVVATDASTQEVGGAGTSCVGSLDVFIIYGAVPGVGAVHAQAAVNLAGRDEAVLRLQNGEAPADIIAVLSDNGFDSNHPNRQYGVVDLSGRAAAYSGAQNGFYANDVQGQVGELTYSVQGNILTSQLVLDQAEDAFVNAGCDLADRLMLALEAGAVGGEGDSRCTDDGIPSDSGFIHVDEAGGAELLHLSVTGTFPDSPLPALRQQFDVWRTTNPCPEPSPTPTPAPGDDDDDDNGAGANGSAPGCACSAARAGDSDSHRPPLPLLLLTVLVLALTAGGREGLRQGPPHRSGVRRV